ncbi:putative tRNA methyltransferase [Blattamonas nauphoetae]|uniref:tRNA (guanine-N(7)-)-methyltransferase n=1 Tax=Blattamonas nauphoetae TaxID=2049346 RepID=A0ABQ9YML1_9EUKA|nr:putative tRNA methyltransferase [Blattamonas nauphoetae]
MTEQKIVYAKFRTRPHSNPLNDQVFDYPTSPSQLDWTKLFSKNRTSFWVDIGCGYGGLLETLGPRFQDVNILGIEIRSQVVDYVENRILKLRRGEVPFEQMEVNPIIQQSKGRDCEEKEQDDGEEEEDVRDVAAIFKSCPELGLCNPLEGIDLHDLSFSRQPPPIVNVPKDTFSSYSFDNIGVIRGNSMKSLVNFFSKGFIERMFILFPDPHWKQQHVRRRVVSPSLCDEYAWVVKPGGRVYTITDVPVVHHWMVWSFSQHPLFERVPEAELENDVCYSLIFSSTADSERAVRKAEGNANSVMDDYDFDSPEAWMDYYRLNPQPFDWLQRYDGLKGKLEENIPQSAAILYVGCGTSLLAEQMAADGYTNIKCIDISDAAIEAMQARPHPTDVITYEVEDALNLIQQPAAQYDAVIDKGFIDAIKGMPRGTKNAMTILRGISHVLRPNGVFFSLSHGASRDRTPLFSTEALHWDVMPDLIPKPTIDDPNPPEVVDGEFYPVMICTKR